MRRLRKRSRQPILLNRRPISKRHNAFMPNIASILKAEISRVARKEVRTEIETLKKASVAHRSSIAELRRQVSALERSCAASRRARYVLPRLRIRIVIQAR